MSKFTKSMSMHLNGGSNFSELHYSIKKDGKPTNAVQVTITDGSPRYLITSDLIVAGEEVYDMKEKRGAGVLDWLEKHAQVTPETESP